MNVNVTGIELIVEMCDVAASEAKDLDFAELPIRWFRRDEQPQCVECYVDAA